MSNLSIQSGPKKLALSICTLFFMFATILPTIAAQHAILIGIWDYENPNLQLDAPPERPCTHGISTYRAGRRAKKYPYAHQSKQS